MKEVVKKIKYFCLHTIVAPSPLPLDQFRAPFGLPAFHALPLNLAVLIEVDCEYRNEQAKMSWERSEATNGRLSAIVVCDI